MLSRSKQAPLLMFLLIICLGLNFTLWLSVRGTQSKWVNVPPPPHQNASAGAGLGDKQFAYRSIGLMLQNLGDSGGQYRPLYDYDYDRLAQWFYLADKLAPQSNYMPFLAAFYFANVQDTSKLRSLIEYLHMVGQRSGEDKWRWLSQGVHLARYRLKDMDLALEIAKTLSDLDGDLPAWAKNMDVLVLSAKGEKQAAYEIMMQTLQTEGESLSSHETLFIIDHICSELLDEEAAKAHPLCQQLPN